MQVGNAGDALDAALQREGIAAAAPSPAAPLAPERPLPLPAGPPPQVGPAVELTARERDVLRLLAAGKSNPAIARALLLSTSTVKGHVQHILGKLGVDDRTQAAVRALRLGLLPPSSA